MMKDGENVALEVPRIMYIREQDIEGIWLIFQFPRLVSASLFVYSVWILSCLLVLFCFRFELNSSTLVSQITAP